MSTSFDHRMWWGVSALSALTLISSTARAQCREDSDLTSFRACLRGSASSCTLPTGTHTVCSSVGTINIVNSSLTAISGGDSDPADTVLQRGDGSLQTIMSLTSAAQGLTIEYLTLDGNRWAFGSPPSGGTQYSTAPNISCLIQSTGYYELNLASATIATVWYVNFINDPVAGLILGGSTYTTSPPAASTVDYSTFGSMDDSAQAARATAMMVEGTHSGAYYNHIYYAGTAGINLNGGNNQIAYGNTLYSNRYEMSDGGQGGDLFIAPGTYAATVAANVIDQNFWFTDSSTGTVNGCPVPADEPQLPYPMEIYGYDNYFYNNEVDAGTIGMTLGQATGDTYNIYISGANPFDGSDAPRYFNDNSWTALFFLGTSYSNGVSGVTLDQIRVCNTGYSSDPSTPYYYSAPFGIGGISFNYTSGTGFTTSVTFGSNYPGNIYSGSTYSFAGPPSSTGSCPSR